MTKRAPSGRRPTIADIARIAGVSKGAVSYALNGQPGISEATRAQIMTIADELGWQPNRAARALSASRADACGLILARPSRTLAFEPFFSGLLSGIESELAARSISLVLQMVPDIDAEQAALRRWWAERRVDGVFLVDLHVDDPRASLVTELGLPAVVVGGPDEGLAVPWVASDDQRAMEEIVRYLAALGHRRIARVSGPSELLHTAARTQAFDEVAALAEAEAVTVPADYSSVTAAQATRQLLIGARAPTAIVFDSDVMALAGLGVAQELGRAVPGDLSLISFEDSVLCELVHPSLTAWTRDVVAFGATAARALLARLDGRDVPSSVIPGQGLTPRGSTAPPPGSRGARSSEGQGIDTEPVKF
jgi:DNA-binding LacI/PurR family transcriptional regulator